MTDRRKTLDEPERPTEPELPTEPAESETTAPAETPTAPKEPETSERPSEPEQPTAPTPHDKPKKPVEAEWTEPESEEESKQERDREKTYGRITVRYEREFSGSTEGRVRQKDRTSLRTPGDWRYPETGNCGIWSVYRIPWSLVSAYKEGGK